MPPGKLLTGPASPQEIGQEHALDGVMIDTLATGIRRLPGSTEVNDWSAILDLLVSEPLSKRKR